MNARDIEKNWLVLFTSLQHVISLSMSIVCPFCASSRSLLSCRFYAFEKRRRKVRNREWVALWEMEESCMLRADEMRTSSSCLSALFLSPSASCFCSAARARESRTSSSLDRIIHSKCRSRSSYWCRTSFRRTRMLEKIANFFVMKRHIIF